MGRLAAIRDRLTYANVVATIALFVALGGASYAAVALPANSVGSGQLSFPIGLTSRIGQARPVRVSICPPGVPCPGPLATKLATVHVSLKKASRLLVVGEAEVEQGRSAKPGSTELDIGEEYHGGGYQLGWHYTLRERSTPINFADMLSAHAGRQAISLVADLQSGTGPRGRTVSFINPQIAVIVLPPLPR
jgi:hypothetical protein